MLWYRILSAAMIAMLALIAFYPALRLRSSRRFVALLALAGAAALTPFLLPPSAVLARFFVALFAGVMAMKMWDLHIGLEVGSRPELREFLGFAVNPMLLVWRKRQSEAQTSKRDDMRKLILALARGAMAVVVLIGLQRLDWTGLPFLLQHLPIATALFVLVTATLDTGVALARLCGARVVDANDHPLRSPTPAEFWRRYNRLVGQFLSEDFFRPMRGLRHPLRSTLAVFAVSGLLHEYLFWMAIGRGAGLQMSFFMLQGVAVAATLRVKPTRATAPLWWLVTFAFNGVSSVLFFASIALMLPIYPDGLPAWLRAW